MAEARINNIVKSSFFNSFFERAKKVQDEFRHLKNRQYNYIPVAYVKSGITNKPRVLKLSEETPAIKKKSHSDLLPSDYALIQDIVSTGHYNEAKQVYVKQIGKYYYLVSAKITKNDELMINSFYKIDKAKFEYLNK